MPALVPRCAIEVSQLPRCPIVSLSLSWADAGEAGADGASTGNATAIWRMRVIAVSLMHVARQSNARLAVRPHESGDPDTYCRKDVYFEDLDSRACPRGGMRGNERSVW